MSIPSELPSGNVCLERALQGVLPALQASNCRFLAFFEVSGDLIAPRLPIVKVSGDSVIPRLPNDLETALNSSI